MQNQLKEIENKKTGRSSYCKYTKTEGAEIGRYAENHGAPNAFQIFKQIFPAIKQQGVSNFKRKYIELKSTDPSEPVTKSKEVRLSFSSSR